jgi:parallel beta-helix repeat protein
VDKSNTHGPWDGSIRHPFADIQTAIDIAHSEDTIFVLNGTYYENLLIDKALIIQNMPLHYPIIDGKYNNTILSIVHPHVTVRGFTFRNTSGTLKSAAITCEESNISIENCEFYRTRSGISIKSSNNLSIWNNEFHNNGKGVYLVGSKDIEIIKNNFTHNGLGIDSDKTSNIFIQHCFATVNGIGLFFNDSTDVTIDHCATYNNNDNQGGMFFESCSKIHINNSIVSHNGFGIKSSCSTHIIVDHSTISYNTHAGILSTKFSNTINLTSCEFTNNLRISIHLSQSSVNVRHSNIYNSICGIYVEESQCTAKDNWWGSIFGPGVFETKKQDNIKSKDSIITFTPWSYHIFEGSGADWNIATLLQKNISTYSYKQPIIFHETDTDSDGMPDWWEEKYGYPVKIPDNHTLLDPDNDGLSNIQECYTDQWGSHPFQKDIFLEFDWMECKSSEDEVNKPSKKYIEKAMDIFADHNITFHIDIGNLGGGEQIPYAANFTFSDLQDYYWNYFLHNDMNNPRKGIFRYGLLCDYGPACGFAFIGWDSLDGFCISADIIKNDVQVSYPRQRFIIGASIHEVGHTLGLTVDDHGGNDNQIATIPFTRQWFKYVSYPSCMNYFYTYLILGFSDGNLGPNDFDDWSHMDFSFFKNTHFTLPTKYTS